MLLVTGATGFIGTNLVESLVRKGHRVRALCRDREKAKLLPEKAEIFIGDVERPQTLAGALDDVDTVIHLAGMVSYSKSREDLFRANAIGTKNLLEHCGKVKRFILSSSVSVYGEVKGEADENYPLSPTTIYGESKLKAETYVRDSGIPGVILRIAPVYGVGSPSWKKNLKILERGFPIPKTRNVTHVVHISDVVQAFEKAIGKGSGIYNIAGKKPVPFVELAETLLNLLGKKPRNMPVFIVKSIAAATGMKAYLNVLTMNRHYFIRKAEKELGYEPKADLRKELKRMVDWYKGLS